MLISDWSSDVCSSDLLETVTYQATHGFSSQLCVAVRLQAGLRIEHVVPRLDAVAAQHDRACARWPAADLSEPGLHAGVVDGRVNRTRFALGKSVSVRLDLGGRRIIKQTKNLPQ